MNLSMRWLSDYVDLSDVSIKEFCHKMTLSGSKVEGYKQEGEGIENVVVGKLERVEKHADSDHLLVCSVDVGRGEPVQIVTGAPNVKQGDIVPVALHGADLPDGKKIKKGKIRGVESNGMLCSLGELGLSINDFPYAIEDGILILREEEGVSLELGRDIREVLRLNDTSVEFEITPNRPDCLSVLGLAREAGATFNRPVTVKSPEIKSAHGGINELLKVKIHDETLCPRYIAGVVKNVRIGPSPLWLRERLRASGVRPINNLVDITNYVMLEYGHPMHAFDIRCLDGNEINVRTAKSGEKITTLDGTERALSENMLVIADKDKPVAVAGVMGGEYSGITIDTKDVVFESACFDGASVRITAKNLGMRSDASARFEKGLDAQNALPAIKRALELVEELQCGEPLRDLIDADYSDKTPASVPFDPEWLNAFLGTALPEAQMKEYLERLGFTVENGFARPPSVRMDITCREDLVEEIARLFDYNNIPKTLIKGEAKAKITPERKFERAVRNAMTALGGYEITTYSFISPKNFDKIRLPEDSELREAVTIKNPLGEDASVMRTTMLPSMLETLAKNYNNRNPAACLFELGREYIPAGESGELPSEPLRLTVGMYGENADFYEIKGMVEGLLDSVNIKDREYTACSDVSVHPEAHTFHSGRCAVITKDGAVIGILGEIHPETAEHYGIGTKVYAAKLLIFEMTALADNEKTYRPLPKFPAVLRDVAVVCDDELPAAEIEKVVKSAAGRNLESVTLFDVYKGKQIAEGKKSLAYSISLRSPDATLTDEQADAAVNKVLKALEKIGAQIRS